ncbi:MAG TPA: AMP-binding protein [Jatrophihabitantaceae bacterium]
MSAVPLAEAIRRCAEADPDRAAITDPGGTLTRRDVDVLSDLAASRLLTAGAGPGSIIGITGENSAHLLTLFFAVWKLGAVPLPLHRRKADGELVELLRRAGAGVVVGFSPEVVSALGPDVRAVTLEAVFRPGRRSQLPSVPVSPNLRIGVSGGSTGPSKLIAVDVPAIVNPERPWHYGLRADGTQVVPLDIVDGTGFVASTTALALGCHLVLMPTFDAEQMLRLISEHRADWLALTQPGMLATVKLPVRVRAGYDVSSLRYVTHYSGGVADWVKRRWIEWLGPERIAESYGATDARGSTWIDGVEWLQRPGSVGRAQPGCEIAIFDDQGRRRAPGELGQVHIRDLTGRRNFHYLGEPARGLDGGWESVGDLGRLDRDGYLYLADRAKDMISTAHGLVAPLPIEGAIEFHDAVRSAIVVGRRGADGFEHIHALVDTASATVSDRDLEDMLATRFPEIAIPASWERCHGPLRDNAGKASRLLLRAASLAEDPPATVEVSRTVTS